MTVESGPKVNGLIPPLHRLVRQCILRNLLFNIGNWQLMGSVVDRISFAASLEICKM